MTAADQAPDAPPRRRAAIEPVISHIKNEHRIGRNGLANEQGGAINAVLAAAGYNFRLLLNWLRLLLRCCWRRSPARSHRATHGNRIVHGRLASRDFTFNIQTKPRRVSAGRDFAGATAGRYQFIMRRPMPIPMTGRTISSAFACCSGVSTA